MNETSIEEKKEIVILLHLGDFDKNKTLPIINYLKETHKQYLNNGFLQIFQVKESAYPKLEGLKRNYGDSDKRVKWRSKQVVDFAFMFNFAINMSDYYLHLEDDVISAPNFFAGIKSFIKQQKEAWVNLEFSTLGFIGK